MSGSKLAVVVFEPEEDVDSVVRSALEALAGRRVAGWLQSRETPGGCACEDIVLTALHNGARRVITQDLGPGAQGCRLDSAAVAEVCGWLQADLAAEPELLVLNRFGKLEAEGGGLRAPLEGALTAGIAVLVPVSSKQLAFWRAYAGDLAVELPCEAARIRDWAQAALAAAPAP